MPDSPDAPDDLRPAYRRVYGAALRLAKKMLGDRFRLVRLAKNAYRKTLDEEDAMGAVKGDLLTLVRMVRAWARRDYREVSPRTLLYVVGAVIYFVSPIDAVPDFIPVVGLADDVAVIAAVVRAVRGDLDRFRTWEAEQPGEPTLPGEPSGAEIAAPKKRGDGAPPRLSS